MKDQRRQDRALHAPAEHAPSLRDAVVVATGMNRATATGAHWFAVQMLGGGDKNVGLEVYSPMFAQAVQEGDLLSLTGYISAKGGNCSGALIFIEQPDSALLAIRLCMGLIPAILVLLGLVVMRGWPDRGAHLQKAAG